MRRMSLRERRRRTRRRVWIRQRRGREGCGSWRSWRVPRRLQHSARLSRARRGGDPCPTSQRYNYLSSALFSPERLQLTVLRRCSRWDQGGARKGRSAGPPARTMMCVPRRAPHCACSGQMFSLVRRAVRSLQDEIEEVEEVLPRPDELRRLASAQQETTLRLEQVRPA